MIFDFSKFQKEGRRRANGLAAGGELQPTRGWGWRTNRGRSNLRSQVFINPQIVVRYSCWSFRPDSKLFFSGEAAAEKHPEKRMKAAYAAYEERQLPLLKKENPNMRLSQLKQMLKKDWMKAPENPMNQRIAAYNEKL